MVKTGKTMPMHWPIKAKKHNHAQHHAAFRSHFALLRRSKWPAVPGAISGDIARGWSFDHKVSHRAILTDKHPTWILLHDDNPNDDFEFDEETALTIINRTREMAEQQVRSAEGELLAPLSSDEIDRLHLLGGPHEFVAHSQSEISFQIDEKPYRGYKSAPTAFMIGREGRTTIKVGRSHDRADQIRRPLPSNKKPGNAKPSSKRPRNEKQSNKK